MTVNSIWHSPAAAGAMDLATGSILTEAWCDAVVSNFLYLGGTAGVLPSLHATALVIDSGGLSVSGSASVVPTVANNAAIAISGTVQSAGTFAMGIYSSLTLQAAVNGDGLYGLLIQPSINTNGKSGVNATGLRITPGTATGAFSNTGILIDAPSGGSSQNIGLIISGGSPGLSVQAGGITIAAGGLNVTGGITLSGGNINTVAADFYGNAGTTGMTTGFIWVSAANGAPSGTPSAGFTGRAPLYYDSNLKRLNIWDGSWRGVTLS